MFCVYVLILINLEILLFDFKVKFIEEINIFNDKILNWIVNFVEFDLLFEIEINIVVWLVELM